MGDGWCEVRYLATVRRVFFHAHHGGRLGTCSLQLHARSRRKERGHHDRTSRIANGYNDPERWRALGVFPFCLPVIGLRSACTRAAQTLHPISARRRPAPEAWR